MLVCRPCEDSGYEWDSFSACPLCEKGKQIQHQYDIDALKYHKNMVKVLKKKIADYNSNLLEKSDGK